MFWETEHQLAYEPQEHWLVDGDVGPGRSNDDSAVNGDSLRRLKQVQREARRAVGRRRSAAWPWTVSSTALTVASALAGAP